MTRPRAEEVALAAPWSSNSSETADRWIVGQRVGPPQIVECGVERRRRWSGRWRRAGSARTGEVLGVHHRSFPRSRRRRAMMFRWISALPP